MKVKPNKDNDGFVQMLDQLGRDAEKVGKSAVYDGAGVIADAVRESLYEHNRTGELSAALGIAAFRTEKGVVHTLVGFSGYDSKTGVPNVLKARVLESGRHGQPKRPFFRKAVNKSRAMAIQAMADKVESEFNKIIK